MSNNAGDAAAPPTEPSAALDVGFASISNGRNGESSSMAESRSSGKRSNRSWRRSGERKEFLESPPDREKRHDGEGSSTNSIGNRARRSGGFLLDSVFANGSPKGPQDSHGKRKAQDGQLRVDKRRTTYSRRSGESSQRGSPLAREVAWVDGEGPPQTPRAPSMDPAQLVQMALSLSESRKRNVSNTLQVPLPASKRVTSMPITNYGTTRASSGTRNRSSQFGDSGSRDSLRSTASQEIDIVSNPGLDNVMYTFSPATLARAEKARKYFELASEYRRVLEHLPPLTPDAKAPGNFNYESRNQAGSVLPEIRRVMSGADERHELGRPYNPIQSLRNRRIRIREKRPFPASVDSWADPTTVKEWVEDVERATDSLDYRATPDTAQIPRYVGDDDAETSRAQQGTSSHRRTDTVGSVITRPENSWTIEPTELLADAYWTEKNDNKAYIENRHGNPVFGPIEPRKMSTPKISVEMHRGRDEQFGTGIDEQDFGENGRPSRRRRLMLPLTNRADETRRKHRRLISRSSSTSSASTTDGVRRGREGDEVIGPLERHMQDLIAKEENGDLRSPERASPVDHWGSKPLPHNSNGFHPEFSIRNSRASLDVPRDLHRRTRSADGRFNSIDQSALSTEERHPTSVVSQVQKRSSTPDVKGRSPSGGRRSLDAQRSQSTDKFPSFSRVGTNDSNRFDEVDFAAATTSTLSPIMSGDQWRPRSSQDTQRPPGTVMHRTAESLTGSLHKLDTSSTSGTFSSIREPGSAVGRLFKGGRDRIGTLVRGERFRNRDKLEPGALLDRGASDVSDIEESDGNNGYVWKQVMDSPNDSSDVSPRASLDKSRTKQKYQLPSFTSSARDRRLRAGIPISPDINPFDTRRSPLSDTSKNPRLIPPRLNIPFDDQYNQPNAALPGTALRFETPRKSYGQLEIDQPPHSSNSYSRSPRQRHWSIYDQVLPLNQKSKTNQVTARDIARVRALLLCSGIKAREIHRRGNTPREPIPSALAAAAATTGSSAANVPLKDENIHAARLLSGYLDTSFTSFQSSLQTFQQQTSTSLHSLLGSLHDRASDQLTQHVHDASDEADAFIVELTTKQPQQTKRVDEAVDTMVRRRRRQFRLLRQVGFKVLEWVVLGIMWGIWAVVVGVNLLRRIVGAVFAVLKWLFTF